MKGVPCLLLHLTLDQAFALFFILHLVPYIFFYVPHKQKPACVLNGAEVSAAGGWVICMRNRANAGFNLPFACMEAQGVCCHVLLLGNLLTSFTSSTLVETQQ